MERMVNIAITANTPVNTYNKHCSIAFAAFVYTNSILTTFLNCRVLMEATPKATSKQYPALGRYSTLSAITNPTRMKMFDAGRNGITIMAKDRVTTL